MIPISLTAFSNPSESVLHIERKQDSVCFCNGTEAQTITLIDFFQNSEIYVRM